MAKPSSNADIAFDTGVIAERERIIKLLMELKSENLLPEQAISKGWKFDEPAGIWWLPQDILIDLIKGED